MGFEVTQGDYKSANEVIDALAQAWDFDKYDNESSWHSVRWGALIFKAGSNTSVALYRVANGNENQVTNSSLSGGSWKIVKTKSAVTLYCTGNYDGFFFTVGTAKSLVPPNAEDKIAVMAPTTQNESPTASVVPLTCYVADKAENFSFTWSQVKSSEGTQLMKLILPTGMMVADNIYLPRISLGGSIRYDVEVDGEKYYKNGWMAIKEE